MRLERVERGFVQYFDTNEVIEKVAYLGDYIKTGVSKYENHLGEIIETDLTKFVGTCTVHFRHKPPKELHNIHFDKVYNSQYGMPVSKDGTKLFVGHWRGTRGKVKNGLQAYDIESDSLFWWLNERKIRQLVAYSNYLVALQDDGRIFKVDIESGEILDQIKSKTIERQSELGDPYVLVDSIKKELCVVDTETMTIVKTYGNMYRSPIINPRNCWSIVVDNAFLQDDILTVTGGDAYPNGVDEYPDGDNYPGIHTMFSRVIDTNFSNF